jgi:hypothetical protein
LTTDSDFNEAITEGNLELGIPIIYMCLLKPNEIPAQVDWDKKIKHERILVYQEDVSPQTWTKLSQRQQRHQEQPQQQQQQQQPQPQQLQHQEQPQQQQQPQQQRSQPYPLIALMRMERMLFTEEVGVIFCQSCAKTFVIQSSSIKSQIIKHINMEIHRKSARNMSLYQFLLPNAFNVPTPKKRNSLFSLLQPKKVQINQNALFLDNDDDDNDDE